MELAQEIRQLIAYVAEIEEDEIEGETHFINTLGLDSLLALEVVALIEKKYRIRIPEDSLTTMFNLNNIVDVVSTQLH
jgi:acyl carrier protein